MATEQSTALPQVEQEFQREISDLDFVLATDARIGAIVEPHKILELSLEEGLKIVGGEEGEITLYDAQRGTLVLACAQGPYHAELPMERDASQGISGRALRDRQRQIVHDVLTDPDYRALCDMYPAETAYGRFLRRFRSTLYIPLLANGHPLGIFCARSIAENDFPERKVKLLEVLLQRTSLAWRSARSREQTLVEAWQRAADISDSLGLTELIATGTSLVDLRQLLYDASARKALELTGARSANLRLLHTEKQHLWFAGMAGDGWTQDSREKVYHLDDEAAATWAIRQKQTYHIDDLALQAGVHFFALFPWARSHVSVPLIDRSGRVLGVLSVTADHSHAFHQDHILSLELLARTITLTLTHVELIDRLSLQSLEQRLAGMETLAELYDKAIHEVCHLLPAVAGSLFMFDPQANDYVLQATSGLEPTRAERIAYRPGEGLTGWVAKHKRPLRLRDCQDATELQRYAADLQWRNKFRENVDELPHPMRYLGVPLLVGNDATGVIRTVSREGNQEFTEADEQWLALAAGSIALAIERLRLRQESKQRIAELAMLYEFSKMANQAAQVDDILQWVLRQGLTSFGCSKGHIRLRDKAADQLLLYGTFGEYGDTPPVHVRDLDQGISGWIARHKQSWFKENTPVLGVPLIVDNQVFGTLVVEKNEAQGFSRMQLRALESLAAIIASTILKHWLSEGLSTIARAIVDITDIDDLYQLMYQQVKRLLPTDVFYVALYDELSDTWSFPYMIDRGVRRWDATSLGELGGQEFRERVVQDKAPLRILHSFYTRPQEPHHSAHAGRFSGYSASLLLAPIVLPGDKLMGLVSAQSYTPDAYTQAHVHILSTIASQASGAIQGVAQLQQARKFAKVRERIYHAGATQGFRGLLEAVLESARELIHYPHGLIRLADDDHHQLILAASYGLDTKEFPLTRPIEAGIIGQAVTSKNPQGTGNAREHPNFDPWYQETEGKPYRRFLDSLEAIIAVPLLVEEEAIGALVVYGDKGTFRPEDILTIQKIAAEAALPIHHATLNTKARLLEDMTDHFQELLKKGNDEDAVLEGALRYALKLTGCPAGHISVLDPGRKWLIRRAFHGDYLRELPERQPSEMGVNGRVLGIDRAQLVTNLQANSDYRTYLTYLAQRGHNLPKEMKDLNNLLVVPIPRQGIPDGILCLHAPQPNIFTIVQMALMDRLGNYIGTLIAQTREAREIQRLAMRAELGDMAAFVAHEINTPLGIILMKAERLSNQAVDQQQQDKFQEIMYEAERGGRIVDELLNYAGRQHRQERACDLNAAIQHALRLIESLPKRKQIQLILELPEIPKVAMGESRAKQIFFNLVRNAVDAMPRGGTLTVRTSLASDGKNVALRVCDTGSGISPDLHEKIFHLYFTTKEHGTGLGLSLCRMLVREQGGDITVESEGEEGKGSTFIVTLPVEE